MWGIDDLFDTNHDGNLDFFEDYQKRDFEDRMAGLGIYEHNEEEDEDDEFDDELTLAGLSRDELSMMDDEERAEALEEAGIDPDDWSDV